MIHVIQSDTLRDTLYIVLSVYQDVLCIKGKRDPKSRENGPLPPVPGRGQGLAMRPAPAAAGFAAGLSLYSMTPH